MVGEAIKPRLQPIMRKNDPTGNLDLLRDIYYYNISKSRAPLFQKD